MMNEWQSVAWVTGVGTVIFGAVWLLLQDVKKGVHARVERCEHVIDNIVTEERKKADDFITVKAFDRFEGHLVNRVDTVQRSVDSLSKRVDDFILFLKNGTHKTT